tara:strand:- start:275 stop:901 length:627 start_codon:yes stop_codon:yes gene_type:complete
MSFDKYFVIGFNKTATTFFHSLFKHNGLTSEHSPGKWKLERYQCFSDVGHMKSYKNIDSKYKNAIFILNVRELDKWLISRFKHGLERIKHVKHHEYYPYTYDKCKDWIYERELYHLEVLDYFSDRPDKLIIVNIDKPGWVKYIATKLNFKIFDIPPMGVRETNNSKEHSNIVHLVHSALDELNYAKETTLFQNEKLLHQYLNIYNCFV